MITGIIFRDTQHPDFLALVTQLTQELAERDGNEHAFYQQFNGLENLTAVVLYYEKNEAVACGAIKRFDDQNAEVKRMYTVDRLRGKGIASKILEALEAKALNDGFAQAILETGLRQPEAIRLYEKNGYQQIENYGPYKGVENSVCFEKKLWSTKPI